MDRNGCTDRSGKSHFGEYGWYDGYTGSLSNCRAELKMRGRCCADADACAEECQTRIKAGNIKSNIISQNIANMVDGEKTRAKEHQEDKELSAKRREEEMKQLEEKKRRDAAAKEGKIICGACKEAIDPKEQPEVKQGIVKCPKCGKKINGQTGELIVGESVDDPKPEDKKEDKKEEPKADGKETPKAPETPKPEPTLAATAETVVNQPKAESSPQPVIDAK